MEDRRVEQEGCGSIRGYVQEFRASLTICSISAALHVQLLLFSWGTGRCSDAGNEWRSRARSPPSPSSRLSLPLKQARLPSALPSFLSKMFGRRSVQPGAHAVFCYSGSGSSELQLKEISRITFWAARFHFYIKNTIAKSINLLFSRGDLFLLEALIQQGSGITLCLFVSCWSRWISF